MKKFNLTKTLYTSVIAGILVSTTSLAAVPTTEIIKPEKINYAVLKNTAQNSLAQSISTIELDISFTKLIANTTIAEKKVIANLNKPIILTKVSLIAD